MCHNNKRKGAYFSANSRIAPTSLQISWWNCYEEFQIKVYLYISLRAIMKTITQQESQLQIIIFVLWPKMYLFNILPNSPQILQHLQSWHLCFSCFSCCRVLTHGGLRRNKTSYLLSVLMLGLYRSNKILCRPDYFFGKCLEITLVIWHHVNKD